MSSKRNASSEVDCKRSHKCFSQDSVILPVVPDEIWYHIASCSPDAITWLNLTLAVPTIGRWSISNEGINVSNVLFSSTKLSTILGGLTKTLTFFKNGKIHRDGDKPAIVSEWREKWGQSMRFRRIVKFYKNGYVYREGDRPTTVGLLKDNEQDAVWWKCDTAYEIEYIDVTGEKQHKIFRYRSNGPAKVILSQFGLTITYCNDDGIGRMDENQPFSIYYSRLVKQKTSSFGRMINQSREIVDKECDYDVEAIFYELTKDVTTNDEDVVFDWSS